jgi:Rhs element Vgr protein
MPEIQTIADIIHETDLVSFELLIDGTDYSNTYQVLAISIHQEINKIPSAFITVVDGETNLEDFAASSSNDFKPGNQIEIKLGYRSNTETVFTGIIISNSLKMTNNYSELNIVAKDEIFRMNVNKGNHHFNDLSCSDIAEQLLSENSISNSNIEQSPFIYKQLVQSNITDWDYMIGLIDAGGMFCMIDNAAVSIMKPSLSADAKLRLTYGSDILDLRTEIDSRIQNPEVKTISWDYKTQELLTEESESASIENSGDLTIGDLAGVASKTYEIHSSVSFSQEEIRAIALAKKTRQELSKIKGSVKYQGNRRVLPGDFILINGIGTNFSGKIFVSAIRHEYAEGDWTTEATLGWDEQFFSEQINPSNAASATGQVSGIQGLQNGIVTDITDSEGDFRVKVRLPAVNGQDEGIYARVATLDAGDNRGTFFRPEIDDEVIVGFVNNDASHPVILGMLHSNSKASAIPPQSSNNIKGYVSRSRLKLVFDDGENSVTIETPGGRIFELNDNQNSITVKDGDGNKITMDASGVTVEAAQNMTLKAGTSISLAAPQLSIKADGTMSVEGGGSLSVKSSGITEITGAMVKIN